MSTSPPASDEEADFSGYSDSYGYGLAGAYACDSMVRDDSGEGGEADDKSRVDQFDAEHLHWNEAFQALVEQGHQSQSAEVEVERGKKLAELVAEFTSEATRLAVTVIDEMFLQDHMKTIKRLMTGGVAGGIKYLKQGVFLKVATDYMNLYGGDDRAMKAAHHELKSIGAYSALRVKGLHFPLSAVVDYRGYSVVCQSLIPISSETLLMGTADGGRTISNKSPELVALLALAAKHLNLAEHTVYSLNRKVSESLWTAADIEGHLGRDGRFYLIDMARAFPPCAPSSSDPSSSFLYRLMRPELVKSNSAPLSPDSFSRFSKGPAARGDNARIREATSRLAGPMLREFAEHLDSRLLLSQRWRSGSQIDMPLAIEEETGSEEELPQLIADLHFKGINCRYLLGLLSFVQSPANASLILCEMVARCVKHSCYHEWRLVRCADSRMYTQVLLNKLQCVFGSGKRSLVWWRVDLSSGLRYFVPPTSSQREWFSFDKTTEVKQLLEDHGRMPMLLERVLQLCGAEILHVSEDDLRDRMTREEPFCFDDMGRIVPRVKNTNYVSFEQATAASRLASTCTGDPTSLFHQANEGYRLALLIRPNDYKALYNWAMSLVQQARAVRDSDIMAYERLLTQAVEKCERAAELRPDDPRLLNLHGMALLHLVRDCRVEGDDAVYQALSLLERAVRSNTTPASLHNAGSAALILSRSRWKHKAEAAQLLRRADSHFSRAVKLTEEPSQGSLRNLAVAKSKLAQLLGDQSYFKQAEGLYERAIGAGPNYSLFFDWGNCLYRHAKTCNDQNLFLLAAEKYGNALALKANFKEAYQNLGTTLEKAEEENARWEACKRIHRGSAFSGAPGRSKALPMPKHSAISRSPSLSRSGSQKLASSPRLSSPPTRRVGRSKSFLKRGMQSLVSAFSRSSSSSPSQFDWSGAEVAYPRSGCPWTLADVQRLTQAVALDSPSVYLCSVGDRRLVVKEIPADMMNLHMRAANVDCPYLVNMECVLWDGQRKVYLIMSEFASGGLLSFWVRAHGTSCLPRYTAQLLVALEALRDHSVGTRHVIKPGHVLLGPDQCARLLYAAQDTAVLSERDERYAAPEVLSGEQHASSFSSLLFSLGCTLYEIKFGKALFAGRAEVMNAKVLRSKLLNRSMGHPLADLLSLLLEHNPKKRAKNVTNWRSLPFFENVDMERLADPQDPVKTSSNSDVNSLQGDTFLHVDMNDIDFQGKTLISKEETLRVYNPK